MRHPVFRPHLRSGVPVTFAYISDAHDSHANLNNEFALGPGEAAYEQQFQRYDKAFDAFFQRLKKDGITPNNTEFVFTVDEGDHFANGTWSHGLCNLSVANPTCPANQISEIDASINALLPADAARPAFDIYFDSAPTFTSGAARADRPERSQAGTRRRRRPGARHLPRLVGGPLTRQMVDPVEQGLLHMTNADPFRTPTFILFANPDFFVKNDVHELPGSRDFGARVHRLPLRLEPRRRRPRDRPDLGGAGRPRCAAPGHA